MAVKDGPGLRPVAQTAKRHFLNCLETSSQALTLPASFHPAQLWAKDPLAGPKHHGSEGRTGPAARSPNCQTSLSELPRN